MTYLMCICGELLFNKTSIFNLIIYFIIVYHRTSESTVPGSGELAPTIHRHEVWDEQTAVSFGNFGNCDH